MRIKGGPINPKALTSRYPGVVIRDTWQGPVVQARPRPGSMKGQPINAAYRKRFGFAGRMASSPAPLEMQTAIEMAKGTEQVPRDILTMAALGRYYIIVNPDGTEWGHVEGPLAYVRPEKGETMWEWSQWDDAYAGAISGSANAWKGTIFTSAYADIARGVRAVLTTVAAGQYRAAIGTINASNVIQSVTLSNTITAASPGQQVLEWDLTATLNPVSRNFLIVGRIDAGATYALPIAFSLPPKWLTTIVSTAPALLPQVTPTVGQTITLGASSSCPPLAMLFNQ